MPQEDFAIRVYNNHMKTWSLSPILMSAYLSAMLTSGLAPIRPSVIFAAAIDPMIAQKALQNAVSAVAASGWAAPTIGPSAPVSPQAVASTPSPKVDPVMTPELMARLIKLADEQVEPGTLGASICSIFKLCASTDIRVKQIETENPEGHFMMYPWETGSKDIVIIKQNEDKSLDCYLTDKTYKLRAAAIWNSTGAKLIPNDQATEKFKAELSLFAREAADLPPTGAAVAGS